MTADEPRKIVEATPDDGWNAWRKLCQYFNPSLASMEGRAWGELGLLSQNTAKTPEETKRLINELSLKIRRVEDISGETVVDTHAKSILLTFMDPLTRQHTATFHGKQSGYEKLKQECLQFINNAGGADPMQLGSVQNPVQNEDEAVGGSWYYDEGLLSIGSSVCYYCNGKGHFARECPSKGKGKGKGMGEFKGKGKSKGFGKANFKGKGYAKGDFKGKGKGRGPAKGCYTCGGPHFASECPTGPTGSTRPIAEWWPETSEVETIKRLSMLKTVMPTQKTRPFLSNSFQALSEDEDVVSGESMQKYETPVEFLNVVTKKRFCIAKCSCCPSISSDSEDFDEDFNEVVRNGSQRNHTKAISRSNMSSFESSKNKIFEKIDDAEFEKSQHSVNSQTVLVTPSESQESLKQDPSQVESKSINIEAEWEALIKKRLLNPVDPVELAKSWDVLRQRHLHRDRRWEVLQKFMPGSLNARIQWRRENQKGYRPWTCNLWKSAVHDLRSDECKSPKTWQEILEEIDVHDSADPSCGGTQSIENVSSEGGKGMQIMLLETVEPDTLNALEDPTWEEIELAVDSGATETVIGENILKSIDLTEGMAYKRGVKYEVANGIRIPNLGEKKFIGVTENGMAREITAQVCEVNKPLLSVSKIVAAGNRVVFDPDGSYIEDTESGEKVWLTNQGGMYMIKMWVKRGF